jgi:hypothetical protein
MDYLPGEVFRLYFDDWHANLDESEPKALTESQCMAILSANEQLHETYSAS